MKTAVSIALNGFLYFCSHALTSVDTWTDGFDSCGRCSYLMLLNVSCILYFVNLQLPICLSNIWFEKWTFDTFVDKGFKSPLFFSLSKNQSEMWQHVHSRKLNYRRSDECWNWWAVTVIFLVWNQVFDCASIYLKIHPSCLIGAFFIPIT